MKDPRFVKMMFGWLVILLLALPVQVAAGESGDDYSREQLTQMLAPVALYPDALLSQVLMAATYPLEVVEADRWRKKNPLLTGNNLEEALREQDWDASVKALCEVPTVLALMSEKLDETTNLGNAFLAQEDEVMEVIQELRTRAYQEGNLQSNSKQKITILDDGTILIEPADPQTVYVPYYDTRYVYGPWWYPAWPPWYWGPGGTAIGASIYFWPDVYLGFGFGFGYWSHFDWHRRTIIINVQRRPRFFRHDYDWKSHQGSWRHEPRHRRGVVYRDRPTAKKFGQFRERNRVFGREVRGFPEPNRSSGRTAVGTGRKGSVRKPVAGGGVAPSTTRSVPAARERASERQRIKSRGNVFKPPVEKARTRVESAPAARVAPARSSKPVPERVAPAPRMNRETARQMETTREHERTSIFAGGGNRREETRSSIRGSASRGDMRGGSQGRGFSGSDRGQEQGGNRSRQHR